MAAGLPTTPRLDPPPPPADPKGPQVFSHYPSVPPPWPLRLVQLPPHSCPYLQGRQATNRAIWSDILPGAVYQGLMDANFRRSGRLFYQPVCHGCRECQSLRVDVARFTPSRSQRRSRNRNGDLTLTIQEPRLDAERYDLYQMYQFGWHKADSATKDDLQAFLYDSPTDTLEFSLRDATGRLLAITISDITPEAISSVYCFFDPAEAPRALGTFMAMLEIDYARQHTLPWYYLGFIVRDCPSLAYKSLYRPCEVLQADGAWRVVE